MGHTNMHALQSTYVCFEMALTAQRVKVHERFVDFARRIVAIALDYATQSANRWPDGWVGQGAENGEWYVLITAKRALGLCAVAAVTAQQLHQAKRCGTNEQSEARRLSR